RVPVARMVVVCNSGGMREQRPLIEAEVQLGPVVKRIGLTVTNRAGMLFRMILGRQALAGDFVVDVSQKYLLKRLEPRDTAQG
ncbi:MAG TPA: RimK/LysX family protein, partial [Gemmataceae bacterium]|nr:RimK/LysX family protein [Gemmataceae bacterium]